MSTEEKTLRTSAFYTDSRGGYLFRFWVMSPAYGKPGYQIKVHEKGKDCGSTVRIADEISEQDALRTMGALEQEAAATLKRVQGRENELGPEFRDAVPFADHLDTLNADTICERLRKRRPTSPSFRLKKP